MSENIKTVESATCTFCGCVCDDMDLTIDMDEKKITKAKNACILGKAWFFEHTIDHDRPKAMIDGKEALSRRRHRRSPHRHLQMQNSPLPTALVTPHAKRKKKPLL